MVGSASGQTPGSRSQGWVVVAALFLVMTVNAGFTFYGLSAYIAALTEHGRFSLTAATIGPTISFGTAGLVGLLVARLLESVDVRALLVVGAILTGSMLGLIGYVQTPWELWALFLVFGAGSACFAMIPASALIVRWFPASPSLPMAIMASGYGAGGTVLPPILAVVIGAWGLERTGVSVGVVLAASVVLLTLLFIRNPEDYTAVANAAPRSNAAEVSAEVLPVHARRALVFLGIAFLFFFMSQVALVTHMLTIGRDRHLDGAPALSALAVANLLFRLLGIPFVARFGVRVFSLTFAVTQVFSLLLLSGAYSAPILVAGAFLFGTTIGNMTVSLPLNVHRAVDANRFASAYARLSLIATVGTAAAPALLGILRTALHGYAWPLILLAAGSGVGAVLLLLLPAAAEARPAPTATSSGHPRG